MTESIPHTISIRAIEDIIQIQKLVEDSPNLKSIQVKKNKSEERIVYSVLKHDVYSSNSADNKLGCILKECEMENSFKYSEKNCKTLNLNGWKGDCAFTEYVNPELVVLENIGIIENTGSDSEVKCWSSDSDVTVLRVKKEFRNELSNKVEWEDQRNLGDEDSISSLNLDWESHSLINLAQVLGKEKDVQETLAPFTIWSKAKNDTRKSSLIFMENLTSFTPLEPCTTEIRVTIDNDSVNLDKKTIKKSSFKKKKAFQSFFRFAFSCISKKKKSLH